MGFEHETISRDTIAYVYALKYIFPVLYSQFTTRRVIIVRDAGHQGELQEPADRWTVRIY